MDVIEDIFGDLGFRIHWYNVTEAYVYVEVFEKAYIQENISYFTINGSDSPLDGTENIEEAEIFLKGDIKFDGCSNFNFHSENTMKHLCGEFHYLKLINLLKYLYFRAFELMNSEREHKLDNEWQKYHIDEFDTKFFKAMR